MKYISLLHVMRNFGDRIKSCRSLCPVSSGLSNNTAFEGNTWLKPDVRPFTIENAAADPETGQVLNMITIRETVDRERVFDRHLPATLPFPPFLELEWLKTEMPLSDSMYDVMIQIACMFTLQIVTFMRTDAARTTPEIWLAYLEEHGITIEVEDLEDAPAILQSCELSDLKLPKYRSWATLLMYGPNFPKLFDVCDNQSSSFKEFYHHMPVLLSLFMVEFCDGKLKNWPKQLRIDMENRIRDTMDGFSRYRFLTSDAFTYGRCMSITSADIAMVRSMFTMILDRISDLNSNIGVISYGNYRYVKGPEMMRASVRLTGMGINWEEEMKRAEEEEKERAAENTSVDGEQEDEVQ